MRYESEKLIAAAVPVALLLSGCVIVKDSANKEEKTEETSKSKASETKENQLIRKKKVKMFKRFAFLMKIMHIFIRH